MARKVEKPAELRKLSCKGCKSEIDEVGCISGCEYDSGQRPSKSMEFRVYVFNRIEPYSVSKKK